MVVALDSIKMVRQFVEIGRDGRILFGRVQRTSGI
jgi:hypothetical protein